MIGMKREGERGGKKGWANEGEEKSTGKSGDGGGSRWAGSVPQEANDS